MGERKIVTEEGSSLRPLFDANPGKVVMLQGGFITSVDTGKLVSFVAYCPVCDVDEGWESHQKQACEEWCMRHMTGHLIPVAVMEASPLSEDISHLDFETAGGSEGQD